MLHEDTVMKQFAQEQIEYFSNYLKKNPSSKMKTKIEDGIKKLQAYL